MKTRLLSIYAISICAFFVAIISLILFLLVAQYPIWLVEAVLGLIFGSGAGMLYRYEKGRIQGYI